MIELIPDPEFNDASKWIIQQVIPPTPAGTMISGGKLIVGTDLIPPSLILGNCLVTPIKNIGAVIGAKYEFSLTIDSFVAAFSAGISYGGISLWTKAYGVGTYSGTFVADDTLGLSIFGSQAGYVVDRISIMADSIRELILQSLNNQLKNITTLNGYEFNVASTSVIRARRLFFDDQLPAIGIFDGDETLVSEYGSTRSDMLVRVEMHADAGTTNRSIIINRMKAALEKAIMSADRSHGGFADSTHIEGYEIRLPDDDDSTLLTAVVIARITYTTVTGNPWANP